uniref:Uncharacterized protein n=1 Tax=Oryza barthii TaxID=65489 RepID=A0A0D3GYU0_9ORYZ
MRRSWIEPVVRWTATASSGAAESTKGGDTLLRGSNTRAVNSNGMPSSAAKHVRWSSSVWLDPDDNNAVTLRFDNGTEAWRYWIKEFLSKLVERKVLQFYEPKISILKLGEVDLTCTEVKFETYHYVSKHTSSQSGGRCGNAGVGQLKQRVLELDAGGVLSVDQIRVGVDEDSEPVQAWKSRMGQSSKRRSNSADDAASAAAGSSNENMAPASAPCLASQTPLWPSVAPCPASPRR